MRTIGRHHRLAETHYPASQFQRHKMHANDHYAAILRLRTGKVVQPVHIKPFANPAIRPEPGHARFKQRHAKRVEILGDQFFPFFPGEGRKTEFNIFLGDRLTSLQEGARQLTGAGAQKTQNRVGKLHQ